MKGVQVAEWGPSATCRFLKIQKPGQLDDLIKSRTDRQTSVLEKNVRAAEIIIELSMERSKDHTDRNSFLRKIMLVDLPDIVLNSWSACDPHPYVPKGQRWVTLNLKGT